MKIAVIGRGLIGGSFEKASLAAGYETAILHHGDANGFEDADLILVCLPPFAIVPWVKAHASQFKRGALVVDICGNKRTVMNGMADVKRDGWVFIGGHPMAGREVAGYENSLPTLFVGASMILTPFEGTHPDVIDRLKEYFKSVGFAMTIVTTPERHDEMIAFTSQLCHVIATAFARDPRVKDAIGFSAGSYANMTRIATQNASDWCSLYAENRDMLLQVLDGFLGRVTELRDSIAAGDDDSVKRQIEEGTLAKRRELLDRKRGDEDGE